MKKKNIVRKSEKNLIKIKKIVNFSKPQLVRMDGMCLNHFYIEKTPIPWTLNG